MLEEGCNAVRYLFIPGSWSAWIAPVQALLLLLDDVLVGSNRLARKASHCTSLVLLLSDTCEDDQPHHGDLQPNSWKKHTSPPKKVHWEERL